MTPNPLQLIPHDDLQEIRQDQKRILELLQKQPDEQFKLRWIESKKVPPLLGISNRTWQSWRDKRLIPFSQFGAKIYVRLDDINSLLESHKIETPKTF